MTASDDTLIANTGKPGPSGRTLLVIGLILAVAASLLVLFWEGITYMVRLWDKPEYNHGFMIPLVAIYLLWLRARDLRETDSRGSWIGVVLIFVSLAFLVLGELSAVYAIVQYGLVLALWAVVLAAGGARAMKLMWVPLLYLAFMVPLPSFIETRLTAGLQLISSELGVAVIRAAGLSVYLEGNVIDLGNYQLQVAEACSGMRYLFPLVSFGFLCAVLFRGRWWQRAILLLSTIPITILMNSFRIGVIGILVNHFGIEAAEGFIHDFEGWVVFMACVLVLFAEIWIFARLERRPFLEIFGLDVPPVRDMTALVRSLRPNRQVVTAVAVLVLAAAASQVVSRPAVLVPERAALATFPLAIGDWRGRETYIEQIYIDELKVSDYMMSSYVRESDKAPVEMWIAYYDSQVKGASVHSPQACLPGGGWQIETFEVVEVPDVLPDGNPLRVNRALISLGEERQLVYYWFAQRGRNMTNEFLVKWYIFWDGLTRNRTDGALVRLTTWVGDKSNAPAADARLQAFIRTVDPQLAYHIPGENAVTRPVDEALVSADAVSP